MTFMIFDFVSAALNFAIPAVMAIAALYFAVALLASCQRPQSSPRPCTVATPAKPAAPPAPATMPTQAIALDTLSIRQLKKLASAAKIKGYSKLTKGGLIAALG